LEVQAFTAEDAERVSAAILEICDALVNEISALARLDAMRSAEKEVARVEAQ
jgi:capsule polysaccharide export protein KpsE/RkpR